MNLKRLSQQAPTLALGLVLDLVLGLALGLAPTLEQGPKNKSPARSPSSASGAMCRLSLTSSMDFTSVLTAVASGGRGPVTRNTELIVYGGTSRRIKGAYQSLAAAAGVRERKDRII